jgi:hypothetical protein
MYNVGRISLQVLYDRNLVLFCDVSNMFWVSKEWASAGEHGEQKVGQRIYIG